MTSGGRENRKEPLMASKGSKGKGKASAKDGVKLTAGSKYSTHVSYQQQPHLSAYLCGGKAIFRGKSKNKLSSLWLELGASL